MKLPRLRTVLSVPLVLFALFYLVGALILALKDDSVPVLTQPPTTSPTIAIFGASGTAGDGILKAALASPEIKKIHVVTRRSTPRIEAGVASGKIQMTTHMDYLDYAALHEQIAEVDAVFWAIGISAVGADESTYGRIHVDFPARFVAEWTDVSKKPDLSFQFLSSSDISEESNTMWVREKIRAEKTLFGFAEGTNLRVIAYRPDYIGPTEDEAHLGQKLLYGFFRPVGAAVKAEEIGRAMIEVIARGEEFKNGAKLSTRKIVAYSRAYEARREATSQ